MTLITSQHNPRLKELRKLRRRRERECAGLFLAEGEDLVAAAIAAGRPAVEGFCIPGADLGATGERFREVTPDVLAEVSALGSGTRAIGVYEQRFGVPAGPLCVCLYGVADPGNVGTVLRGALAFGASSVAIGPGCADPHSPKAVRASMGAIFAVALARVRDVGELPGERIALVAGAGEPLWNVLGGEPHPRARMRASAGQSVGDQSVGADVEQPVARQISLLVGAEREGLPDEVVAACERVARIPIASESLNAAMAATVALYEMTRPSTRVPPS